MQLCKTIRESDTCACMDVAYILGRAVLSSSVLYCHALGWLSDVALLCIFIALPCCSVGALLIQGLREGVHHLDRCDEQTLWHQLK